MSRRRKKQKISQVEAVERRLLLAGNVDTDFGLEFGISTSNYTQSAIPNSLAVTEARYYTVGTADILLPGTVPVFEDSIGISIFLPNGFPDASSDGKQTERVRVDLSSTEEETALTSVGLANGDIAIGGTVGGDAMVAILRPQNLGSQTTQRTFTVVALSRFALPGGVNQSITDVAVGPDGDIYAAGVALVNVAGKNNRLTFVAKYTTQTSLVLDRAFGDNGFSQVFLAEGGAAAGARIAFGGGSIFVGWTEAASGTFQARVSELNSTGGLLAEPVAYRVGGQQTALGDLLFDPAGRLIIGGTVNSSPLIGYVAAFDLKGSLLSQNSSMPLMRKVNSLALQPDGKILVGGADNGGPSEDFASVTRLRSDLTLDASYGDGGNDANIRLTGLQGVIRQITLDSLGGLVYASDDLNNGTVDHVIGRLLQDIPNYSANAPTLSSTTLTVGSTVSGTVTVNNISTDSAPATTVRLVLNNSFGVTVATLGNFSVPALQGSTSTTVPFTFVVPGGVSSGSFTLIARVDPDNTVFESNDFNNTSSLGVTLQGPDLAASSFSLSGTVTVGVPFTPGAFLMFNSGAVASGAFQVRYDLVQGGTTIPLADVNVSSIPAFGNITTQPSLTIPAGTPAGTYQVRATIDQANVIAETTETNNSFTSGNITVAGPDLAASGFSVSGTITLGTPFTPTSFLFFNQGNAASGAFTVRYSLVNASGFDLTLIDIARAGLPSGAGNSATTQPTLAIPAGTPAGTYQLRATLDAFGQVAETNEGNNTFTTGSFSVVGADLTGTGLITPDELFVQQQFFSNLTLQNNGTASSGNFSIRYEIVSASNVTTVLTTVNETSLVTGGSRTSPAFLTVPAGTPAGTYTFRAVLDSGNLVAESNENNNILSKTVTVTQPLPDLTGSNFSASSTAAIINSALAFNINTSFTVTNAGTAGFSQSSVRYRLLSGANVVANFGTTNVSSLTVGSSTTLTPSFVTSGVPAGTYTLEALIDPSGTITESNEANNQFTIPITLRAIDLALSNFTVNPAVLPGTNLPTSITITNNGNLDAPASTLRFQMSTDPITQFADVPVPALAAGASVTLTPSLAIPAANPLGAFFITASVELPAGNVEASTANNFIGTTVTVAAADLSVSSFTAPSTVFPGSSVATSITVFNSGNASAPASKVRIELVGGSTTQLGDFDVPALAAGQSATITPSVNIVAGTPLGNYTLVARSDATALIVEASETNNSASRALSVQAVNLVPSNFTAPATVLIGNNLSVSLTITNSGNIASPATTVQFILGTTPNTIFSDVAVPAIAAGASVVLTPALPISASSPLGSFLLSATVDPTNAIPETSEANTVSTTVTVQAADLTISTFTAPATVFPGDAIATSITLSNQGNASAPASKVRLELVGTSTIQLGDFDLPALAAGSSSTITPSVTIPAGTTLGSFTLRATADATNLFLERFENNNTSTRSITVQAANLSVSTFNAPGTVFPGDAISTSITVNNLGNISAAATKLRLELIGTSTIQLGDFDIPAIAAGGSATITPSVTIPAGTALGNYTLRATADATGLVAEADETNNASSRSFSVNAPNLTASGFTAQSALSPGQTLSTSITITNTGNLFTEVSSVTYQLRSVSNPASVTVLGNVGFGTINPGSSVPINRSFVVPNIALGSYTLEAVLDASNTIRESSETDNTLTRPFTLQGVDLQGTALSLPTEVFPGNSLPVSITVVNKGNIASAATATSFTLTGPAGFVRVNDEVVPVLNPDGTVTLNTSFSIPGSAALGAYSLEIRIDSNSANAETNEANNTFTIPVQVQAADLDIALIDSSPSVAPGGSIPLSFIAQNLGNLPTAATTARLELVGTSTLLLKTYNIRALAADVNQTGTTDSVSITESVSIPAGTALGDYTLRLTIDPTNTIVENNELNNVSSAPITVQGLDLTISALSAPSAVSVGTNLSVGVTVSNLGNIPSAASVVRLTLTGPSSINLGDFAVASLPGGSSTVLNLSPSIPLAAVLGSYTLSATVDPANTQAEVNETNNARTQPITLQGVNLVAQNLTVPPNVLPGATFSAGLTISNSGNTTSQATTASFTLSSNPPVVISGVAVPAIAPGGSIAINADIPVAVSAGLGAVGFSASVDPTNTVAEFNESDNSLPSAVFLASADLNVLAFTAPNSALPGASLPLSIQVNNQGNIASRQTQLRVLLIDANSSTQVLDVIDLPAIAPGTGLNFSPSVVLPPSTALGNYTLRVIVDPAGDVDEIDKSNNVSNRPLAVQGADLVMSSFTFNDAARIGSQQPFSFTVRNQGNLPGLPTLVRITLESNPTVVLGTFNVPALQASESFSFASSVTINASTDIGEYSVTASADPDNTQAEVNEGNNAISSSLLVTAPNYTAQTFTAPSAVFPGNSITPQFTFSNTGNEVAPANFLRVVLKDGDTQVADLGLFVFGDVNPGASVTLNPTLTIPASLPLKFYTLIATLDPNNTILEDNENDNSLSRSLTVQAANLQVAQFTAPATSGPGQTVPLNITFANVGNAPSSAGSFSAQLIRTGDGQSFSLGSFALPAIGPASQLLVNQNVTLPAQIPPGSYSILITADSANTTPENNETDNTRSAPITLQLADFVLQNLSAPDFIDPGATLNYSFTVRNLGNFAAASTPVRVQLVDTQTGQTSVILESFNAGPLNPAQLQNIARSVVIPSGTVLGSYNLVITVDPDSTIPELNENDNVASVPLLVGRNELVVSNLTLQTPLVRPGDFVIYRFDLANTGTLPVAVNTLRLSVFDNNGSLVLETTDTFGGLLPGASGNNAFGFTLPADAASGTYQIQLDVDPDDLILESDETNNTAFASFEVIGSNLTPSDVALPAFVSPGSFLNFTVPISNTGSDTSGNATVRLELSGPVSIVIGDYPISALVPGDTINISDSFFIPADAPVGDYQFNVTVDIFDELTEDNETDNFTSSTFTVVPADLEVSDLFAPSTQPLNQPLTVDFTIINNSQANSEPTTAQVVLITEIVNPGDLTAQPLTVITVLGTVDIPSLVPGQLADFSTSLSLDKNAIGIGTRALAVLVDPANNIPESVEDNNQQQTFVTFTSAQLEFGSTLTVPPVSSPIFPGSTFNISFSVFNDGNIASPATEALVRLDGVNLTRVSVPAVAAGSTVTVNATLTAPADSSAQPRNITLQLDPDGIVPVLSPASPIGAQVVIGAPDASVSSLSFPGSGGVVRLPVSTINLQANIPVSLVTQSQSFLVRFELRTTGQTQRTLLAETTLVATAQSSSVVNVSASLPQSLTPGSYEVIATVDPDGAVAELNEANNQIISALTVLPPLAFDLVPTLVSVQQGQAPLISVNITNNGNTTAPGTFVRYLLLTSSDPTPQQIAAAPELLTVEVGSIGAGFTVNVERFVSFPDGLPVGTYFIAVQIDGTQLAAESNESNNLLFAGPFNAGTVNTVDLVPAITSFTVTGTTARVIGTITNAGNSASAATQSIFNLFVNANGLFIDRTLGSFAVPALAANTQQPFDVSFPVPGDLPLAFYFATIITDFDNLVAESDESNNFVQSLNTQLAGTPAEADTPADLVITGLTSSGSFEPGQQLPFSFTVSNLGETVAPPYVVSLFLSPTATFDVGTARLLGNIDFFQLVGNGNNPCNTSLAVPLGTPDGNYFVIARADSGSVVTESNEANNDAVTASASVTVTNTPSTLIPELALANLAPGAVGFAGQSIPFTLSVSNSGSAASASTTVRIFARANLNATPILLGDLAVPALTIGASAQVSGNLTLPNDLPSGSYFLTANVDPDGQIAESIETNNTVTTDTASLTVQERPLGDLDNVVGRPDNSFGQDGLVTLRIPGIPFTVSDTRIDAQGRLVAAGFATNGDVLVLRLTPAGQLDGSFANGGVLRLDTPGQAAITALHLFADGSVLLAGSAVNVPASTSARQILLARITSTGQADAGFGTNGVLIFNSPATGSAVTAMAVRADGSVLIGLGKATDGFVPGDGSVLPVGRLEIIALAGDGSVIPSFGSNGVFSLADADFARSGLTPSAAAVSALVTDAAGNVFVIGNAQDASGNDVSPLLVRLSSTGQIDTRFARGRILLPSPAGRIARVEALTLQTDGKLVIAGSLRDAASSPSRSDLYVFRIDTRGNLDRRLGSGGFYIQPAVAGVPFLAASRVIALSDGRIVVSAKASLSLTNADVSVVGSGILRLTARGQADPGFGTNGFSLVFSPSTVVTPASLNNLVGEFNDFVLANQGLIALTPGGGILALASSTTGQSETTVAITSIITDGVDLSAIATARLAPSVMGGSRARITLRLANDGSLPANGTTNVALYFSNNSIAGVEDTRILTVPLRVSRLSAGKPRNVNLNITFPTNGAPEGTFHLFARVNDSNAIPEINDRNNAALVTSTLQFARPFTDLAVSAVSVPSSISPGSRGSATVTVTNRGNTTARLSDIASLFASSDVNFDSSDLLLGTAPVRGSLKPGQSRVVRLAFTPPSDLAPGGQVRVGARLQSALPGTSDPTPADNQLFSDAPVSVI